MTQFSSPNATSTAGVDVVVSTSGWVADASLGRVNPIAARKTLLAST